MNLDPSSFILLQIDNIIGSLNKRLVFDPQVALEEVAKLVSSRGLEAQRHLFRSLFGVVDFAFDSKTPPKDSKQAQLLRCAFAFYSRKPYFADSFCFAVENYFKQNKNLKATENTVVQLGKILGLSKVKLILLGFILLRSRRPDLRASATDYLKNRLPALIKDLESEQGINKEFFSQTLENLQLILTSAVAEGERLGVNRAQLDKLLTLYKTEYRTTRIPLPLVPLLYPEASILKDSSQLNPKMDVPMAKPITGSLALQIQEIGYGFCASADACKKCLAMLGVNITPSGVAHVLAMMVRTYHGLKDGVPLALPQTPWPEEWKGREERETWDVANFVTVLHEIAPNLNWSEVVMELDHPGFMVKDKPGLRLLTVALLKGLRDKMFPIALLYKLWNNKDGQLSWLKQIILNPDVFCLEDVQHRNVSTEMLRIAPDEADRFVAQWKCLDLIEILLQLSDAPGLYGQASECFLQAKKACPDLLILGLLQISMPINQIRQELLLACMPIFLGNHPNSIIVLQAVWNSPIHTQQLRQLMLSGMAEWYLRGPDDPLKLGRLLDIAHDLKALSNLLNVQNVQQFPFVLDLACLASRREYLKLEKWITDKIQEHGEPFVQACIIFLKRRFPNIVGGLAPGEAPKPAHLPPETLATLLMCLQTVVSNVSPTSAQEIMQVLQNCRMLLAQKAAEGAARGPGGPPGQQQPPGPGQQQPILRESLPPGGGPMTPTLGGHPAAGGVVGRSSLPVGAGQFPGPGFGGNPGFQGTPMRDGKSMDPFAPSFGAAGGGGARPGGTLDSIFGGQGGGGMPNFGTIGAGGGAGGGLGPGFGSIAPTIFSQGVPATSPATAMMQSASGGLGGSVMNFDQNFMHQQRPPGPMLMPIGGMRQHHLQQQQQQQAKMAPGQSQQQMPPPILPQQQQQQQQLPLPGMLAQQQQQQQQMPSAIQGLQQAAAGNTAAENFPDIHQQFTGEVQDESNAYFQQIYTQPPQPSMSIEQFLDILKRFKVSPDKKERDVFACMIKNLFEEYRFFPQYPDKELYTTALLFGGIVREGIVGGVVLSFALKVVLEALRKEPQSKMWYFGVCALDKFRTKLKEHPGYCQHITSIAGFPAHYSKNLLEYICSGSRQEEPPPERLKRSETPILPPGVTLPSSTSVPIALPPQVSASEAAGQRSAVTFLSGPTVADKEKEKRAAGPSLLSTNIDILVSASGDEQLVVPSESITERVAFLFNNLSRANLSQKIEEMRQVLAIGDEGSADADEPAVKDKAAESPYLPWLSQYLVMKRVSIEPNFHVLYSLFVDALSSRKYVELVTNETYRNIKVLLRSDKDVSNFSDRSLLKNLGHWLGMISVGKDKPILQRDLDMKSLLLEAYNKGQQELLYVVPFVAKIIESCKDRKIFKPPSPWTMGIMSLLAELHREPDLKLNLKFEIEVLCNHLELNLAAVTPPPDRCLLQRTDYSLLEAQLGNPKKLQKPELIPSGPSPVPAPSITPTPLAPAQYHPAAGGTDDHAPQAASAAHPPPAPLPPAAQPKFGFGDINISSLQGLSQHISINASLPLFQLNPPLKNCVKAAIERAVNDLCLPVADRAIKVACSTTEHIVRKDFALDPDENHLRHAGRQMVRSLTAGMAMISCREPLLMSMQNYLKTALQSSLRGATDDQLRQIDEAVNAVADDNVELAQCFVVKQAVERAMPQLEIRLREAYEARKAARAGGQNFCDQTALKAQQDHVPLPLRVAPGSVAPQQTQVYDAYAKQIPGFKAGTDEQSAPATAAGEIQAANEPFSRLAMELESWLKAAPPGIPQTEALTTLKNEMVHFISSQGRDNNAIIQNILDCLLEKYRNATENADWTQRVRQAYLAAFQLIQASTPGPQAALRLQKQITKALMENKTNARYNIEAVDFLIRNQLICMATYDIYLAQSMEAGLNYAAVHFAMKLLRLYLIDDRQANVTESDLFNTIDALAALKNPNTKLTTEAMVSVVLDMIRNNPQLANAAGGGQSQQPQAAMSLLEMAGLHPPTPPLVNSMRAAPLAQQPRPGDAGQMKPTTPAAAPGAVPGGPIDYPGEDPSWLQEKAEIVLREWVTMYHNVNFNIKAEQAYLGIVTMMNQFGLLKTDELITRFLRLCTEMCCDLCYRAFVESNNNPIQARQRCFNTLDAYAKLIGMLLRNSGEGNLQTKMNLVNKILAIIVRVVQVDHTEIRRLEFNQLPYHRLLMMLFTDLTAPGDPSFDQMHLQILQAFWNHMVTLQPRRLPGFTYAWLDIIGNRVFLERMLAKPPQAIVSKTWQMYAYLIIEHLKFLSPFLRNIDMRKPLALIYKGTLRILLVLLHDFPELLCEYHFQICDVIPANCVQLRNLVLSAYPRLMRLPDPFLPTLKVEQLPEISQHPRLNINFDQYIPTDLRTSLDSYLKNRSPVNFLSDLRRRLEPNPDKPGQKYNVSLMNAIVLYVGVQAIQSIADAGKHPSSQSITHSAHMDIFQNLAVDLDTEGRYLFFNAIANQLRYPNNHTYYFSCTILYLFAEANAEAIQEQITRILFERLMALRPHPWGLLITFIELIKNPIYRFWSHQFVRCAPEIQKLFESVARSCMAKQNLPDGTNQ